GPGEKSARRLQGRQGFRRPGHRHRSAPRRGQRAPELLGLKRHVGTHTGPGGRPCRPLTPPGPPSGSPCTPRIIVPPHPRFRFTLHKRRLTWFFEVLVTPYPLHPPSRACGVAGTSCWVWPVRASCGVTRRPSRHASSSSTSKTATSTPPRPP